MVQDSNASFLKFRNLTVILIQHHGAVRVARNDVLHPRVCERSTEFFGKFQEKIFISGAPCRFTATSFSHQNSPGNTGRIKNLLHRKGDGLPVGIETESTAEPEQPFLLPVEDRKSIRVDQLLPRIVGDAPGIVWGTLHGRKELHHFLIRDAALTYQSPAEVQDFPSHMLNSNRTRVLASAAG